MEKYYRVNASNFNINTEKMYTKTDMCNLINNQKLKIKKEYNVVFNALKAKKNELEKRITKLTFDNQVKMAHAYNIISAKILNEKRLTEKTMESNNYFCNINICNIFNITWDYLIDKTTQLDNYFSKIK